MKAVEMLVELLEDTQQQNLLGQLLQWLATTTTTPCSESGTTDERCWEAPEDEWPRDNWCSPCTILEPLLREVPS